MDEVSDPLSFESLMALEEEAFMAEVRAYPLVANQDEPPRKRPARQKFSENSNKIRRWRREAVLKLTARRKPSGKDGAPGQCDYCHERFNRVNGKDVLVKTPACGLVCLSCATTGPLYLVLPERFIRRRRGREPDVLPTLTAKDILHIRSPRRRS